MSLKARGIELTVLLTVKPVITPIFYDHVMPVKSVKILKIYPNVTWHHDSTTLRTKGKQASFQVTVIPYSSRSDKQKEGSRVYLNDEKSLMANSA